MYSSTLAALQSRVEFLGDLRLQTAANGRHPTADVVAEINASAKALRAKLFDLGCRFYVTTATAAIVAPTATQPCVATAVLPVTVDSLVGVRLLVTNSSGGRPAYSLGKAPIGAQADDDWATPGRVTGNEWRDGSVLPQWSVISLGGDAGGTPSAVEDAGTLGLFPATAAHVSNGSPSLVLDFEPRWQDVSTTTHLLRFPDARCSDYVVFDVVYKLLALRDGATSPRAQFAEHSRNLLAQELLVASRWTGGSETSWQIRRGR